MLVLLIYPHFYFIFSPGPQQLQIAALPLCGRLQSCRVSNTTNKKAKLTYQNCPLNLNWSTIIVKHKETASSFHKCCQGRKHTQHTHITTLSQPECSVQLLYISIYTYRYIHKYTQSNLVNVIRSAEREGNRPASHLCIGNTGEIDE